MARPTKKEVRYRNVGRKIFDGKDVNEVMYKLENAFIMGFPDKEACDHAGISLRSLYNYQRKNPEFVERKKQLPLMLDIRARRTIIASFDLPEIGVKAAQWWLEKFCKKEYGK